MSTHRSLAALLIFVVAIVALGFLAGTGHVIAAEARDTVIEPLLMRIKNGDREAALEIGRLNNSQIVPALRELLKIEQLRKRFPQEELLEKLKGQRSYYGSMDGNLRMALAKLGDDEEFQGIVNSLSDQSPMVQEDSVKMLLYIAGAKSVRVLMGIVTSDHPRFQEARFMKEVNAKGETVESDVMFGPLALSAIDAVQELIKETPGRRRKGEFYTGYIARWRQWWVNNSRNYQN